MEDKITFVFIIFFTFLGSLFGYHFGISESKQVIAECEKTLPRNVHCTIIAVPVDKN